MQSCTEALAPSNKTCPTESRGRKMKWQCHQLSASKFRGTCELIQSLHWMYGVSLIWIVEWRAPPQPQVGGGKVQVVLFKEPVNKFILMGY